MAHKKHISERRAYLVVFEDESYRVTPKWQADTDKQEIIDGFDDWNSAHDLADKLNGHKKRLMHLQRDIDALLSSIIGGAGMDLPTNFDQISLFIYNDILEEIGEEISEDEVSASFQRWIEKQDKF
jgi:hypothetical protein